MAPEHEATHCVFTELQIQAARNDSALKVTPLPLGRYLIQADRWSVVAYPPQVRAYTTRPDDDDYCDKLLTDLKRRYPDHVVRLAEGPKDEVWIDAGPQVTSRGTIFGDCSRSYRILV